ncbi:hypothetical protein OF83DRAFT_1106675 [Amylostereum chailletii]|nr:hypothetical protein OF83DRAFT_1106675 [Amylostereum chailletii]
MQVPNVPTEPPSNPLSFVSPEDMLHTNLSSAILLATIPTLDTPHFLAPVIANAARCTHKRLVIVLFSRVFNSTAQQTRSDSSGSVGSTCSSGVSRAGSWDEVQRLLTFVYVQATKVAQDLDRVLMEVDVLLKGFDEDLQEEVGEGMDIAFRIDGDSIPSLLPLSVSSLRTSWAMPGDPDGPEEPPSPIVDVSEPSTYHVVALGGTFDHLHAGHKILLSMAAWIADEKIIVGVTDDALLVKKANKEVMESLDERIRRVRAFLELFKPGLVLDIVPITDVYGPTGWDPNIQALVVSRETLSGGAAIDKHRAASSLPPLKTFVIDVISHNSARLDDADVEILKQTKMSSTFIRGWIAARHTLAPAPL